MDRMTSNLEQFVRLAKNGNRQSLETVVGQIQDDIYGLALRMLGLPEDAEDESQEILIKVIPHLSDFREESAFRSWVYRIACDHLLTTRKRKKEHLGMTFDDLENVISTKVAHTHPLNLPEPEREMLLEETRIACMQGVLTCQDRKTRIAFILGELFGVSGMEAAFILNTTADAFRQRLSRGRERIRTFMLKNCGLVDDKNPCRCDKMIKKEPDIGPQILGKKKDFPQWRARESRSEAMAHLKELSEIERVAELFRNYPTYYVPDAFKNIVKKIIDSKQYRLFMI